MFEVAKKIDDKSFFIRLNTLCNAADEVTHCDTDSIEIDDISRVISDIGLLNVVKCELDKKENKDLNMNNINTTCIILLQNNNHADINPSYKRYLTQLILGNIPYVEFIKLSRKNELEKFCSTKQRNDIIDTALENAKDNMSNIFETAR